MNDIEVTANDITTALANMSNKISRIPDEILAYFLKRIAPRIIDVLCHLYQLSLSTAKIPYQWKQALVIPIHKKGTHKLPSNYRPISLTCVMCSLLESIIAKKLLHYLSSNNLFSFRQYGFIPGRSTSTQLMSVLNKWHYFYDSNLILMLYTLILLKPLTLSLQFYILMVLVDHLISWIKEFLCNRSQSAMY